MSPLDDLQRHAAERPDAIAIATPRGGHTFADLKELVDASAQRLRAAGVSPRQLVALDLPSAREWVLDLALMRLAARSVSIRGVPGSDVYPDVLIVEPGSSPASAPTTIEVDELWMLGALADAAGQAPAFEYPRPDSIFRLMLTSGTTGTPRTAAYSVAAFEHRRLGLDAYWTDDRAELDLMPLSTTGGFHTAAAALRHGSAYLAVDHVNEESLRFAAQQSVQVLCGSPNQIASALEVAAQHDIDLTSLEEVRMAGAAPSQTLLRLIADRLDVAVRGVYGSTEGGGVTMRMLHADDDPDDVGEVLPGLELQIVDEAGTPVEQGTEGTIRYRGPGMTSGYDEHGTVVPFRGGWFSPGDRGAIRADGSLLLVGRESEILNIAGLKVNPSRVDALALDFPGVRDAATFPLERANGIAELGIAVVIAPGCDVRALDRMLRQNLRVGHPTTFWTVADIPRNRMGKVDRGMLTQAHSRVAPR